MRFPRNASQSLSRSDMLLGRLNREALGRNEHFKDLAGNSCIMANKANVLIDGAWVASRGTATFRAVDPVTGEEIGDEFPVSPWEEIDLALAAATRADAIVRDWPAERFAKFLETYASAMEAHADRIVALAHQETALPISPRLRDVELPRAINQMKVAAECARGGGWALPVLDTKNNIRSCYRSIGPVFVLGPNNFPLAINSISGQDFAAAIAAGNPVIAKGHPSHPGTTRLFGELAAQAAETCGFPGGFVQLLYHLAPEEGLRMIQDARTASVAFTGSRQGGLKIKAAADACGKPSYLEMSSINPVFVLPGYLSQSSEQLANDFFGSCLMGSGQFCTNPGLIILPAGPEAELWVSEMTARFAASKCGPLFSAPVREHFLENIRRLASAGAEILTGGKACVGPGFHTESTLLRISADEFLKHPLEFQQEAFGNGSLLVTGSTEADMLRIADALEGQLTGCVYLTEQPADEQFYRDLEPILRRKVGRLLNNKMPTGVAVSPAMNHGGPYPATGHAGFTAVGLPASIRRFSMLQSYDNVPEHRLPPLLKTT